MAKKPPKSKKKLPIKKTRVSTLGGVAGGTIGALSRIASKISGGLEKTSSKLSGASGVSQAIDFSIGKSKQISEAVSTSGKSVHDMSDPSFGFTDK
jgi:hypothetical protein